MKIIAFGASPSKNSINKKLATYVSTLFEQYETEVLDLNDFAMPLFSVDLEKEVGQHPLAQAFLDKIGTADLLVISMAENNGNYSAAFKNTFDWASRINVKVFQDKPMLLMATSPGGRGGASVLEIAKNAYGCDALVGEDAADAWAKKRDGLGADLVVDAAGHSSTLKIAMKLVRQNGQITKVGWGPQPLNFSIDPIVQKNVRLQGSFSHNWPIWERVIALLASGALNVKPIIGGVWPITDWHTAFEKMHTGQIVKAVLKPV